MTLAAATAAPSTAIRRQRLDSVDLVRGLVMVIMALDHVRDFFHHDALLYDPSDLTRTTTILFLTRWITHFCAPTFVLLAGVGAFLYGSRGRSRADVARFLVTRGLWLIVAEVTVIRFAFLFNLDYGTFYLQVIWVIGVGMIVLAGMLYLPRRAILAISVLMIAAHDLLDGVGPPPGSSMTPGHTLSAGEWAWSVLHVLNPPVLYPLIPWIGVLALGYCLGPILLRDPARRRRALVGLGMALTAAFVVIRALNGYGDPSRWSVQRTPTLTLLSFLNTSKYPPSLLFLLMTLGPSLLVLGLADRARGAVARFFIVFGRVPFFYYILHFYLIHLLALAAGVLTGHPASQFMNMPFAFPHTYGFNLATTYAIWAAVVLTLYPLCRWFAGVKARRTDAWLSYL
jgi:uncharacterized membrane protein